MSKDVLRSFLKKEVCVYLLRVQKIGDRGKKKSFKQYYYVLHLWGKISREELFSKYFLVVLCLLEYMYHMWIF